MSQKHTKTNQKSATRKIESILGNVAFGAMAIATVLSAVDIPEHREVKAMPVLQPAFAFANDQSGEMGNESMPRYQRQEEIAHPHAVYGSTMRSHATAGSR